MFITLRAKLLFIFLLITFLSLFFIGYNSYQSQKEILTNQLEKSFFMFADSLALNVNDLINDLNNEVDYLADNPIIKDPNSTPEQLRNEFIKFTNHFPYFNDVIIVDNKGIVTVDMLDGSIVGNNFNSREWFQKTKNGGTYFSDVYQSPVLNKPMLVMATAVKDDSDNVIGVISPAFKIEELWRRVYEFTDLQSTVGINSYAFLFNEDGTVIAHPENEINLEENYFKQNNLELSHVNHMIENKELCFTANNEEVSAFSKISKMESFDHSWYLGISVSETEFFSPLKRLLYQYIVIFGLSIIVTVFAIFKLSSYLVSPINKLVAATSDLAVGKKLQPIEVNSYKEINKLSEKFNYMIEQVQVREEENKKSTLILETTDNGIFAISKKNMAITTFNKTCEFIFGINKDEVLQKNVLEVAQQNHCFKVFIEQANLIDMLHGTNQNPYNEFNYTISGKKYYIGLNLRELPNLDPKKESEILIVFSDLTEIKTMEQEILRSEKLKVIGELSASFAHEIRNPLTTIRGFIQLLDANKDYISLEKKYSKIILQEIDRINGIVTDLMNMAKPNGDNQYNLTNINQILEDITILYDGQISFNKILIINEFDNTIPAFFTYGSKLKQVFINLIKNAFEAMPEGGMLSIKTVYIEKENSAEITFADTGVGMDKDTLSKLRKLFFTTKASGTGLGLPMCYMIIEDMGGAITVDSKVGLGTTFTVRIDIDEASQNQFQKTVGM